MKRLLVALFVAVLGFGLAIADAEAARRLGGGKTMGAQRDGVSQRQATPPAASPAAPSATPNAAAPRPGMSRWLAPLAGLAAGLGLAYLFGDQLGSLLMGALLIGAVMFGVMMLMRAMARRNAPQTAAAGIGGRAPYGATPDTTAQRTALNAGGGAAGAAAASHVPAGFDVEGFLTHAKKAFFELQAANDRGDLGAIREMTTDGLFQSLKSEIDARGDVAQQVDVVRLNAELLEVVTEGTMHWASVRFTGSVREAADALPEQFTEIWNLQKPADGSSGWTLAGIQQV